MKLVAPFLAVVLLQALIAGLSLEVLSSVRAYVAGEAIWSRAQKNAVYNLSLYLGSSDINYFRQHKAAMAIPLGDQYARRALEQNLPGVKLARLGFLQGGNHIDDVRGLIWLFRYFKQVSYLKAAIAEWQATDWMLLQLSVFGDAVDAEMKAGLLNRPDTLQNLSANLYDLNTQLTNRANTFSSVLGEGSRAIKTILTALNVVTATVLILLVVCCQERIHETE